MAEEKEPEVKEPEVKEPETKEPAIDPEKEPVKPSQEPEVNASDSLGVKLDLLTDMVGKLVETLAPNMPLPPTEPKDPSVPATEQEPTETEVDDVMNTLDI